MEKKSIERAATGPVTHSETQQDKLQQDAGKQLEEAVTILDVLQSDVVGRVASFLRRYEMNLLPSVCLAWRDCFSAQQAAVQNTNKYNSNYKLFLNLQ